MPLERFKTKRDVFNYIAQSSTYGNLGLFIGAGLPMAILNSELESIAVSWGELVAKAAAELELDYDSIEKDGCSYPEVASKICKKLAEQQKISFEESGKKFKRTISNLTSWYPEPDASKKYNRYFETINPNWIITTNYDLIIECILTGKGYSLSPDDQLVAPNGLIPVYHLHGIRTNPDSIIITQEDYIELFRPNQYRQQKLSLTIKESVTILIGYNLGDFNVLTAMDWSRNVFREHKNNYPQDIIQFYYTKQPKKSPYRDNNNIIIVEFNDLSKLLLDLTNVISEYKIEFEKRKEELKEYNEIFQAKREDIANGFIDDAQLRKKILTLLSKDNAVYVINGFLELFSKSIDITWERAQPNGAFEAYNECLIILLDLLEYLDINSMPPALVESIAYNLNGLAYYIGRSSGKSYRAYDTWESRKESIPMETKKELLNIAKTRYYYRLKALIGPIDKK